jgi:hypothetical protein
MVIPKTETAHNQALNTDRPKAALLGSLRATRSGGRLALRYAARTAIA